MDQTLKARLLTAISALVIILSIGTFGYYFLTGSVEPLFDCFYMTVITLATIGFDQTIELEGNVPARVFTIFIAFSGIGFLSFFISTMSAMLLEGTIKESYKSKKMNKSIYNLEGHHIICGLGRNATHLLDEFISTNRECIAIDIDKEVIQNILIKYPHLIYINGDASDDEILMRAGIAKAKGLFASTSDDNANLVISLSARRLNPKLKIVALCSNHGNTGKLRLAGADSVVSTNFISGMMLASEMLRPTVTQMLDVMLSDRHNNFRIEQIDLEDRFMGRSIGDLLVTDFKDVLLIALKTNDQILFKPPDDVEISNGDSIIIITTPEKRIQLEKRL
ncbi:MAG: potassium channel protein [Ignavibacteria bacterium]